ncbi:MAG: hypothetical protein MGAcid_12600 [uncultured Acidilobus sp. MG]|nr:MAG: hypothetical protein MGAcid_12600 [uncultured Acidilobus sp. MG]
MSRPRAWLQSLHDTYGMAV